MGSVSPGSFNCFSPAADDGFAGQGEIQEVLSHAEREGVLQRLPVDNESEVVLLVEGISQHPAVVAEGFPCSLHDGKRFVNACWCNKFTE